MDCRRRILSTPSRPQHRGGSKSPRPSWKIGARSRGATLVHRRGFLSSSVGPLTRDRLVGSPTSQSSRSPRSGTTDRSPFRERERLGEKGVDILRRWAVVKDPDNPSGLRSRQTHRPSNPGRLGGGDEGHEGHVTRRLARQVGPAVTEGEDAVVAAAQVVVLAVRVPPAQGRLRRGTDDVPRTGRDAPSTEEPVGGRGPTALVYRRSEPVRP